MGYLIYEITLDLMQYGNTDISTQKIGYYPTWLGILIWNISTKKMGCGNCGITMDNTNHEITWHKTR
jgi:hypothetical protein